jgi:hypothetical protein
MKYRQEIETENGWTEWIQPIRRGYKMACCDCGLVHVIDFRMRKGQIQFRARRDNRATGQRRRYKNRFSKEPKS